MRSAPAEATTNAVAAAAGASPGTLYQFFGNKQAVAEALVERYLERLAAAHGEALDESVAELPLADMLRRIVDPIIAFDWANPGFHVLLSDPGVTPEIAGAKAPLQEAMFRRVDAILALRAPGMPDAELPSVAAEVRDALHGYLAPHFP
ncbi:MAG: TetR/AcrR family transcriptional regulator [Stackebrandtia sp.]